MMLKLFYLEQRNILLVDNQKHKLLENEMRPLMTTLRNLQSITVEYIEDSILPVRVKLTRGNGSVATAGGKFLRTAIISLIALTSNERSPNAILEQMILIEDKIDPRILAVL